MYYLCALLLIHAQERERERELRTYGDLILYMQPFTVKKAIAHKFTTLI